MDYLTISLRLVLSLIFGGIVGFERETSGRPAGLRTHLLVCMGSTLITIVSITGFPFTADPARVAAQIVSGVGFLGAGTIMKEGLSIKGLTTAASLWVVAGIGLALGTGNYLAATITTAFVIIALAFLRQLNVSVIHGANQKRFTFVARNHPGLLGVLGMVLGEYNIDIESVQIKVGDGLITMEFDVHLPNTVDLNEVLERLRDVKSVVSIEIN
jgi:putative Mg2+ transporter-C (MgtC) family protein